MLSGYKLGPKIMTCQNNLVIHKRKKEPDRISPAYLLTAQIKGKMNSINSIAYQKTRKGGGRKRTLAALSLLPPLLYVGLN
uniref:Uncharacterized protein n=1 Tax=Arundo donax TaxID=35708 RepID=A0A0A9FL32_ARUDO